MEIFGKLLSDAWAEEFTLDFLAGDYFTKLGIFINREYAKSQCYPPKDNIFRMFRELSPSDAKVVILSQDPYSHKDEAIGRAFAINEGSRIPPSLRIIETEVRDNIYSDNPSWKLNPTLDHWVAQGVFLLNTSLTVREGEPGSHSHMWGTFTKATLSVLNKYPGKIFLLWGKHAQQYENLIDERFHYILRAAHPASEAYKRGAGFFECNHFSKVNEILEKNNGADHIIKW